MPLGKESLPPLNFSDDASEDSYLECFQSGNFPQSRIKPQQRTNQQQITQNHPSNDQFDVSSAMQSCQYNSRTADQQYPPKFSAPHHHSLHTSSTLNHMPAPPAYEPHPFEFDQNLTELESSHTGIIPINKSLLRDDKSSIGTKLDRINSFATKLEFFHETILEKIMQYPEKEQVHLISVFSCWAKNVSQAPLSC